MPHMSSITNLYSLRGFTDYSFFTAPLIHVWRVLQSPENHGRSYGIPRQFSTGYLNGFTEHFWGHLPVLSCTVSKPSRQLPSVPVSRGQCSTVLPCSYSHFYVYDAVYLVPPLIPVAHYWEPW